MHVIVIGQQEPEPKVTLVNSIQKVLPFGKARVQSCQLYRKQFLHECRVDARTAQRKRFQYTKRSPSSQVKKFTMGLSRRNPTKIVDDQGDRFDRTATQEADSEHPCFLTIHGVQYDVTSWGEC